MKEEPPAFRHGEDVRVYGVALKGASHRIGYDSIAASGLVCVMAGKTAIAKGSFKMKLV